MSLSLWSDWSQPEADPYAWLDHWLDQRPGSAASLLAVGAESALHGRLLYLRNAGAPAELRLTESSQLSNAAVITDRYYRQLSALSKNGWSDGTSVQSAPFWLPQGARTVHPIPIVQEGRIAYWLMLCDPGVSLGQPELTEFNLRAALGLGTARLNETARLHRAGSAAVHDLAEVQRLLQPQQPQIRGLEYALHWQPAETAAGDYYDVMALNGAFGDDYDDRHGDIWGAMIGDVSGHGAAAAMEAAQFDAILRTFKPDSDVGPGGALSYANRYFFSRQSRQRLMTVLATRYRPDTQELVYANAGHLPLLLRRGDAVEVHSEGDIPIGVLRDQQYRNLRLRLNTGDSLLMYTDGVIEARDANGREFGQQRMHNILAQGPQRPQAMLREICETLFRHQGGQIGSDDQTVVVLRVSESSSALHHSA